MLIVTANMEIRCYGGGDHAFRWLVVLLLVFYSGRIMVPRTVAARTKTSVSAKGENRRRRTAYVIFFVQVQNQPQLDSVQATVVRPSHSQFIYVGITFLALAEICLPFLALKFFCFLS
jgi:hypothetical protein